MNDQLSAGWDRERVRSLLAPIVEALGAPTSLSPLRFDLNAGVPDRATLPADELSDAAQAVLREHPAEALTYGGAQGFEPLRRWIADRAAREWGMQLGPQHVSLTSGSAHGLDNIASTFIAPGDRVILGAPSYPGAIRTFRARGAEIITVPQDHEGLRIDELAGRLDDARGAGTPVKLLYLVPTYDNPSGSTVPAGNREAIVEMAARHGVLIVEDDAYRGIDLDGPPPRSLFELAGGEGVIYAGTFSKTVASGLRVAWLMASEAIIERLVFMRFDNGASPLLHRLVLHYLEHGSYREHVGALQAMYRERRDASAAALREHCAPLVTFTEPAGGFFHWLDLQEGITASDAVDAASKRDVAVTPGTMYYADGRGDSQLRLVFSALEPDELTEAIARLGEALKEVAGRRGAV